MPKDARKNVDRYKLAGGHLNEFEFHQNQAKVKEPATQAAATKPVKGASAKKLAAKKAAKKSKHGSKK